MAFETTLRAQDFVVKVRLPQQSDIVWLTEFLHPHFQHDNEAIADCTVTLVTDRPNFDQLHCLGPVSGNEQLPCFLLDGRTEHFPQWNFQSGAIAVYEENIDAIYVVTEDGGSIDIVAKRPRYWLRMRVLRIIRELMMAHLRLAGWFIMHAAAGLINGRTFAIAGPKNSGKTSLLVKLIRSLSAQPVTYDRIAVLSTAETVHCRGVPTMISVRPGTMAMNADLFGCLDTDPERSAMTEKELADNTDAALADLTKRRMLMNPRQFCRLFDTAPADGGVLSSILFPQLDGTATVSRLDTLTPSVACNRLQTSHFGFNHEPHDLSIFAKIYADPGHRPEPPNVQIERLADRVRAYDYIIARNGSQSACSDSSLFSALTHP